ncbi:MAG: cytidylate kinase-like family protein [bacterium]|nr:cytidylate kinase-like family protein [bacterium]
MGAITISRQYGTDGQTIGSRVATDMEYLYVDRSLIEEVAIEAKVPVSEVERFDEHPENRVLKLIKRLLTPLDSNDLTEVEQESMSLPGEMSQKRGKKPFGLIEDTYLRLTRKVMRRLADEENVVLLGRGGQALLTGRSDVLHVRIVAPRSYRVKTIMEQNHLTHNDALAQIAKIDIQRKEYIERHYGIDWNRPGHYHLVINVGWTPMDTVVRLIVEDAKAQFATV